MKCKHLFLHGSLTLLTLAAIVVATPASVLSQNTPAQPMSQQSTAPPPPHDNDNINQHELLVLDEFLQTHPEIAQQLRKNPGLIDDKQFLANHPALQQLLSEHPGVDRAFKQNPGLFMRDEERFQASDDVTQRELGEMNQFLESHPEIAEQLRKNPALLDNKKWVADHPALQQFLSEHAGVAEAYERNPHMFMRDEDRYDHNGDRDDITRRDLAVFGRFLDSHPEIAEQLSKHPDLVNDKRFVTGHPALQQFLQDHPQIADAYRDNPSLFMRDEQRFDRHEDAMQRNNGATRDKLASFNEFLGKNHKIADDLSKNPSLANNGEYVENHPELRDYLKAHPEVHEELSADAQGFVQSAQQLDTGTPKDSRTAKVTGESKPK
jgi:phage-related protein